MKHQPTVPTPPDAWLAVWKGSVVGVFSSRDDPELDATLKEWRQVGGRVEAVLDHPSLPVSYHGGMGISNASWLTARDNWFARYEDVLEPHLRDQRMATVYTLAAGNLTDPLVTHKSSKDGPFPFPKGKEWPRCGFCDSRLGFLGVLDFRSAADPQVPRGSVVLHVCTECGVCSNREAWAVTWIKDGDDLDILGDRSKQVLVGTPWQATEYPVPVPGCSAEDLASSGPFLAETGIFMNFSCFADKVGGRVFWIQPGYTEDMASHVLTDEESFISDQGERMKYIGQMVSSPDIEIGDGGIAYILYSPRTGETIMEPQWF